MDGAVRIRLLIKCYSSIDSVGFSIGPRGSKLRVGMIQVEFSTCTTFENGLVPHSLELFNLICGHVHHLLRPYPHGFDSSPFLIIGSLCSDL
jgi:hypothetical protein